MKIAIVAAVFVALILLSLSAGAVEALKPNEILIAPSGDNVLQATWTDSRGNSATVSWAYKTSSSSESFVLADSNGNPINVREGEAVSRDHYIILGGDNPRLFQVWSVNLDRSNSAGIELHDVFSGERKLINTGTDHKKTVRIGGNRYDFEEISATSFKATQTKARRNTFNTISVWPTLEAGAGKRLAFVSQATLAVADGDVLQLPTGSIKLAVNGVAISGTAVKNENGKMSTCQESKCFEITGIGSSAIFTLGSKRGTGLDYKVTATAQGAISLEAPNAWGQPALLLVEGKGKPPILNAVVVRASVESSGSSKIAIPSAPYFTDGTTETVNADNPSVLEARDTSGTSSTRNTSGKDTMTLLVRRR